MHPLSSIAVTTQTVCLCPLVWVLIPFISTWDLPWTPIFPHYFKSKNRSTRSEQNCKHKWLHPWGRWRALTCFGSMESTITLLYKKTGAWLISQGSYECEFCEKHEHISEIWKSASLGSSLFMGCFFILADICGKDPAVQVSELETRNHRDTACSPLGCPATTYWEVTASYLKWQWYWVYQSHIRTNKVIYLKVHSLVSLECSQDKTFFLSRSTHTSVCTHNHSSFQPVKREDKC